VRIASEVEVAAMGVEATSRVVAEWLGGPFDGKRVPLESEAEEYALAFDASNQVIDHPRVQRYVSDPAYWLKDRSSRLWMVRIYPVDPALNRRPVIRWHERNYRIVEAGNYR
jgi:hypothetical protein